MNTLSLTVVVVVMVDFESFRCILQLFLDDKFELPHVVLSDDLKFFRFMISYVSSEKSFCKIGF